MRLVEWPRTRTDGANAACALRRTQATQRRRAVGAIGRVFHSRGARPGKSVIGPRAATEMGAFVLGQSAMGKETVVTWLLFRSGLTFELSRVATPRGVREKDVRCHVGLNERLG